jgi:hypothetical protein
MASAAQISANRANAQLSTGPVTAEGKTRVSQNALTHGLTAKHLVVAPEEQEEFAALRDSLTAELAPQGALETITFHELLHAAWNLARFRRLEVLFSPSNPESYFKEENVRALERILRYQVRAQRAYYRALAELRTLQTNRAARAVQLDEAADALPVLADLAKMTKQTRSAAPPKPIRMPSRAPDLDPDPFPAPVSCREKGELVGVGN